MDVSLQISQSGEVPAFRPRGSGPLAKAPVRQHRPHDMRRGCGIDGAKEPLRSIRKLAAIGQRNGRSMRVPSGRVGELVR